MFVHRTPSLSLHLIFIPTLTSHTLSHRLHQKNNRLAQLRVYIEKIRPIDKQLSYQVDKLLRATAKVQASADSDAAAAAAAGEQQQQDGAAAAAVGGGHALQYRPNPQALISKVPLVGDTAGVFCVGVYAAVW